ncbi:SpoIIE family protein phosphatase [Streptomyces sp. A7024]|uniref:SpoIIE family protein phosphatase n=1 Tax=Streptomyces coryli TaxID=1128680 RepID=A0A6G4TV21_9ACTN|nr:PP2C family protein-serine/threonine phosphatase [Streptomyces coryli]NGN62887.1 SpoIIE family protein phosphatase [Streptomyces coryli]
MPSHLSADRPAARPPGRSTVDALISQLRRLRTGVDSVRRETFAEDSGEGAGDPQSRWQRALCDLAAHQLDDLGTQLGQLREGLPADSYAPEDQGAGQTLPAAPAVSPESVGGRVGSAEWDLRRDTIDWSGELYEIFGRDPGEGPLSLDELPSWIHSEDQRRLAGMVTDCLVDGKTIDGEFRIVRPDGEERTLHMVGEPVLDAVGGTISMWAVLRDVSELRRTEKALSETRDSLQRQRHIARTEHRLAVELQEAVLPPWRGSLRFPPGRSEGLDLGAHYFPAAAGDLVGGDWYDALALPDGSTFLSVGDLAGHGVVATSGMAMLLGAVRGMAMTGLPPAPLLGHLNELLENSQHPAVGSTLCCRYEPVARRLEWAQAGHPPPLLFRGGEGRALATPRGVLLGAAGTGDYGQQTEQLLPGDVLLLHTDGLAPADGQERLLALAGRFAAAGSAQTLLRAAIEEFGGDEREDDACVLVARVS